MSSVKPSEFRSEELGMNVRGNADGEAVITYTARDLSAPLSHLERLEWIRTSYKRFIEKVLEKEELIGAQPLDVS